MAEQTKIETQLAEAREIYSVFGRNQRALGLVDGVLANEPDNVEALNLRAAILYDLDREDEAADYHQRALAVEPCSVEALHGMASIANDRNNFPTAITWADRGLASISDDPSPEFRENEDYRQRLIAALYTEKAFAFWYLQRREDAERLLTEDGPRACPMEQETFEEELEWLESHPNSPDE